MNPAAKLVLPFVGLAAVFVAWHIASTQLGVDPTILPPPLAVLGVLKRGIIDGAMYTDIVFTLYGAMAGLVVGSLAGFLAGIVVAQFSVLGRFFYPVILGAQSMPTVAIAPLLAVWLGIDIASKITLVAISCFFPMFIATVSGLSASRVELRDLYRVFSAGRLRTLWELQLPGALHYIFAGFQVAVVVSFIVCVVGEFVSSVHGLGHLIKTFSDQLDVSTMFAAIVLLAVLGALAAAIVRFLHRRIVFWEVRSRVQAQ